MTQGDQQVPNPAFAIGIDGGATQTQFVVIDQSLAERARAVRGPSNFQNAGLAEVLGILKSGIKDVSDRAGLAASQIAAIGIGLAGVGSPEEQAAIRDGLAGEFAGVKILVDNDAYPALVGGSGQLAGIVAISGTGSIIFGIDPHGARARAGGWGYHLDRGSGYAIARESLAAVASAQDRLGPTTALTDRIQHRLGLNGGRALIDWLYGPERRVDDIAALAAETVAVAEEDPVAAGILSQAAEALSGGVITVCKQLAFGDAPFPVIMAGGVFEHSALLRDLFTAGVRSRLPQAAVSTPQQDGALGAAMLALQSVGTALPGTSPVTPPPLRRPSEQRNRLTMYISRRSTLDFLTLMNLEDRRVARAIEPELSRLAALVDAIAERFSQGGRLLLAGAGTSGRLAVLDAAECVPTFNTKPEQVVGLIAGGTHALTHSVEGAEDSEEGGRKAIADLDVEAVDSVIGVAASGSTPFVRGVLREASARGALTGSIANAPDAPISALAEHPITIITGPEVIMGSTRLKAGSSQKMALNMITTGVMVRVGKTYHNLMVDMIPGNIKLRERAGIMVSEATGLADEAAGALLDRCGGEVKTAITVAFLGVNPDEARRLLDTHHGNLNEIAADLRR